MKKAILLLIVFMLIPVSYSVSNQEYFNIGLEDTTFRSGEGEFSEPISEIYKTKNLNDGKKYPLVDDVDNDGQNEIFALDGQTAKIYRYDGTSINLIDSYTLPTDERTSNFLIYDIDNDNYKEIILIREVSEILEILEYNGTDFYNQSSITFPHSAPSLDAVINCDSSESCLMFWIQSFDVSVAETIHASPFNSTKIGGNFVIDSDANSGDHFCFPQIKSMQIVDYDNDGTSEYILSLLNTQLSGDEEINIYSLEPDGTLDYHIRDNFGDYLSSSQVRCDGTYNAGRYITNPLAFDFTTGGNLEFVIGTNVNTDEFKIYLYEGVGCSDDDSCFTDQYPQTFNSDGKILSNMILADVFSDSGLTDFCVFGYRDDQEELTLLCGSPNTNRLFGNLDSAEFVYSTDTQYNLSDEFDDYSILAHSGQHKTQSIEIGYSQDSPSNPDEFIISYGVFEVSDDTYNGSLWRKTLKRTFENTRGETALIPVDYGKINANDLIGIQSSNLIYIDDGLSKSPAQITFWEFNPCPVDTTIKINETMDISVIVTDQNPEIMGQDQVSARITIYEGTSNEQTQALYNFTSGGEFQATGFKLNKTIVNGNIKLEGWDTSHPATIDEIDISFNVAQNGLSYNDATCSQDLTAVSDEEQEEQTEQEQAVEDFENTIENAFRDVGIPLTIEIIWLIVMVIVAFGIWTANESFIQTPQMALGVIAISEILMLILGVKFGFVGLGTLISIIVIGLIAIAMWLRKSFSSGV